jgi:hypothetical protein
MYMTCGSWCLQLLVKKVRPHTGLAATRVDLLGRSDQCGVDIFDEFVCARELADILTGEVSRQDVNKSMILLLIYPRPGF